HVAGMMHRYWGDAVPGYGDANGYQPDEVFSGYVLEAMDVFDEQLARIRAFMRTSPDTILVIASSMGQGGITYRHIGDTYVVDDARRLAVALGLEGAEP